MKSSSTPLMLWQIYQKDQKTFVSPHILVFIVDFSERSENICVSSYFGIFFSISSKNFRLKLLSLDKTKQGRNRSRCILPISVVPY